MKRFLPTGTMRNFVAFFRRDIFRAFFSHEDRAVRMSAYRSALAITTIVVAEVIVLSQLTNQIEITIQTFQKGTASAFKWEYFTIVTILFTFAILEYFKLPVRQKFYWNWREAVTCNYVSNLRASTFLVTQVSQRITDTVRFFTQQVLELYFPILRAFLMACVFLPMLWWQSGHFSAWWFPQGGLVYFLIAYCAVQTYVSWYIGRPLVELQKQSQAVESKLRSALEKIEEGKGNPSGRLRAAVAGRWMKQHIRGPMRRINFKIILGSTRLNGWRALNTQIFACSSFTLMFLAKDWQFVSNDLGTLMNIAAALIATHDALSVGSELMIKYTEAEGSWGRLKELEAGLVEKESSPAMAAE